MAHRCRPFTSLEECLNPVYFDAWGRVAAVKKCIDSGFYNIQQKAYRRISQHGSATIVMPELSGNPEVVQYISNLFLQLYNQEKQVEVCFDSEKSNKNDILVEWVPISLVRTQYAIPTGWDDNEEEYTWQDVLANSHEYPSSSTDFGPPLEFQLRAQEEKVQNIQKYIDKLDKQTNDLTKQ